ncbi:serine protease FAM111A-like [Ptychodera flava]|uniref:serine protease FAM111A-like n=1 Tax=Ptychodera flava TaxID=63121 RepID=UPI00396AAB34
MYRCVKQGFPSRSADNSNRSERRRAGKDESDGEGIHAEAVDKAVVQFTANIRSNANKPRGGKSQSYKQYMNYEISCNGAVSIMDAPKYHDTFTMKNPNFDYSFIFPEVSGDESTIPNLGAPVKLFEGKTIVYDVKPKLTVKPSDYRRKFFPEDYKAVRGNVIISMKSEHVRGKITNMDGRHYKNSLLAVTFLQGESLREALEKDGRFKSNVIQGCVLRNVKNKDAAISPDAMASAYQNKVLYIDWDGKPEKTQTDNIAEDESVDDVDNPCPSGSDQDVLENLGQIEDMFPIIAESYKSLDFSQEGKSKEKVVSKILAKPFSSTYDTLSVAIINRYQKSTGIIYIHRGDEQLAIGTGFILKFPYVLTNHHVIDAIYKLAGEDHVRICFNYTTGTIAGQPHSKKYSFIQQRNNSLFMVYFQSPEANLDYAILKLHFENRVDTDEAQDDFPALAWWIAAFPTHSSALSIMGHPYGRVLQMDTRCSLALDKLRKIPVYLKLSSFDKETARSALSVDRIAYDTNMFEGASGSPVFTPQGHLVALHTRGCFRQDALRSEFEQGVTLKSIINDIKKQATNERKKTIMSRVFSRRFLST